MGPTQTVSAPSYKAAMTDSSNSDSNSSGSSSDSTSNADCIFCKIVAGKVSVHPLFEDEKVLAFEDREPQAPTHILVIPKGHITSHVDATPGDEQVLGRVMIVAAHLARQHGLDNGYRLVINCGREGGQTVPHLHLHILGGRKMGWPPG